MHTRYHDCNRDAESEEVFSVRAYRDIRELVPDTALRLSEGRNCFPPCPAVSRLLGRLFAGLLDSGRVTEYECPADRAERQLVAELVSLYLGWPDLTEQNIVFVSGAQEGISLVYAWAALVGLVTMLPLPVYYSFEQSAQRWGVPVTAYFSTQGQVHGRLQGDLLAVRIVPNAVTGTFAPEPQLPHPPAFTLVDAICQVGDLERPGALTIGVRNALTQCDPQAVALVMTASKDLGLPRLRAGVLVTRNKDLLAFARQDRFERISADNPLPHQVIAYYLALLCQRAERFQIVAAIPDISAAFENAGLRWLSGEEVDEILAHWAAMAAHNGENLRFIREHNSPLLVRLLPQAGYSLMADLSPAFRDPRAYLDWCRIAGREYGLKLNPCYVLGGTPGIWEHLYPGRSLLRVNLSTSRTNIMQALDRLSLSWHAASRENSFGSQSANCLSFPANHQL